MTAAGRRRLAAALIVVATATGFAALAAIWVERQALDTEQWVETSGRLLENDEIREQVARYLTDQLFESGQVEAGLEIALPPRLEPLAGPASAALQEVTLRAADELLQLPRVLAFWEKANRRAHEALLAVIDDEPVAAGASGLEQRRFDGVSLDLTKLRDELSEQLGIRPPSGPGAKRGREVVGELARGDRTAAIEILAPNLLETAQEIARILRPISLALVLLTLGLYAGAIWLTPGSRRTTLQGCGISLVVVGAAALALRALVGDVVVEALASPPVTPAAFAAWAIGTSLLGTMAAATIAYGVLAIAAGLLAGPWRPAVAARRAIAPALRDPLVAFGGTGAVILLLVWWAPTPALREPFGVIVIAVILLLGVAAFRLLTLREFPRR